MIAEADRYHQTDERSGENQDQHVGALRPDVRERADDLVLSRLIHEVVPGGTDQPSARRPEHVTVGGALERRALVQSTEAVPHGEVFRWFNPFDLTISTFAAGRGR